MDATIQGAGVELTYAASGEGTPVLLVHGIAQDARAWAPLVTALAGRAPARTIVYDRRGYGASEAPEPYGGTTVAEQAQDARAVLGALDAALAVGVGADLGALVLLDLLIHSPELLRGAVLVSPPLHQFSLDATEALSRERAALEEALREQGPEAAVGVLRPDADDAVRAAHGAVFADYAGLATLPVTRGELRGIAVPVVVVTAPDAHRYEREEADALIALLADGRRGADGDVVGALAGLLGA